MQVLLHINGDRGDHEVKTLRPVNVKCSDCPGWIEPERLRFAAKKGIKIDSCDSCGLERRAKRARQAS